MALNPLVAKAVDVTAKGAAKGVKWILGNPVASRVAGGILIASGAANIVSEITAKNSDKVGAWSYIKGFGKIAIGGLLMYFNDPRWYTNNGGDQFLTSLNFQIRKGVTTSVMDQPDIHACAFLVDLEVPYDNDLSFDTAIENEYVTINNANNNDVNYTQYVLRAYNVNLRNICALYSSLVRLYGTVSAYNSLDASLPRTILKAQGVTEKVYYLLMNKKADFRTRLFNTASEIASKLPGMGDFLNRVSWMFSNYYCDDNSTKAVTMFFRLSSFVHATYDRDTQSVVYSKQSYELYDTTAEHLDIDPIEGFFSQIDQEISNCILLGDITLKLAGDMTKAYGTDAYPYVDVPQDTYISPFLYTEEVLTQIENISAHPDATIDPATGYPFINNENGKPIATYRTTTEEYLNRIYVPSADDLSSYLAAGKTMTRTIKEEYYSLDKYYGSKSPLLPLVINSPEAKPNIALQLSYTRLTNGESIRYRMNYYTGDASVDPLDINTGESVEITDPDPDLTYDTYPYVYVDLFYDYENEYHYLHQTGENVRKMIVAYTDNVNPSRYTMDDIDLIAVQFVNNFIVSCNTHGSFSSEYEIDIPALGKLIHAWSNIDWMPRMMVILPNNTVEASVNFDSVDENNVDFSYRVDFHFENNVQEIFDEKIFAIYPDSTKSSWDGMCISSLYYVPILVKALNAVPVVSNNKNNNNKNNKKQK